MRLVSIAVLLAAQFGCMGGGGANECGPAECAAYVAAAGGQPASAEPGRAASTASGVDMPRLSAFEAQLVAPIIEDARAGVRPFTDDGIGICRGKRECDVFLGTDVGELPQGDYLLKAELRVPRTGDAHAWTIEVATDCEVVRKTESGESRTTSNNSRSYDVRYAGEDRGYRLMPLRSIESPSTGGHRTCTYKITAPHPDGDKVYTGSWSTPDAG